MTVPHWSLCWEVGARTHFGTHFRLVRLACPFCPVLSSPAQASGNSDDMRPQAERAVLPLHSILVSALAFPDAALRAALAHLEPRFRSATSVCDVYGLRRAAAWVVGSRPKPIFPRQ